MAISDITNNTPPKTFIIDGNSTVEDLPVSSDVHYIPIGSVAIQPSGFKMYMLTSGNEWVEMK